MNENINDIIMLLCKGMSNRKLYFSDHPKVTAYTTDIIVLLKDYFLSSGKDELFIGVVEGIFVFDGKRLFGPSVTGKLLIDFATILHGGGFGLKKDLTVKELKKFLDLTTLREVPVTNLVEARALMINYGIKNIRIGDPFSYTDEPTLQKSARPWEGKKAGPGLQSPTFLYQVLYDVVSKAHGAAALNQTLDIESAKSVSEFMLRYTRASFADVMQHVHYPDYDSYTVGHSVRVSSLAVYVAGKMNSPKKDLLALGTAGLLHDVGKSAIPDEILLKKGRLTKEEYTVVKKHPKAGVELLLSHDGVSSLDIAACWGHHIRYDGGGYPLQPQWASRHPVVALLQICDVFEALTAVRPYKSAMVPQQAYGVMLADKGAFHPGLLASFISLLGLYPPGTFVKLSDNRVGMVTDVGRQIDRPNLKIVKTEENEPLEADDCYIVELHDPQFSELYVDTLLLDQVI